LTWKLEISDQGMPMIELSGQKDRNGDLRELGDPEFFAHWAAVRWRLVSMPNDEPGYYGIKRQYDAIAAEYRRRIDGGLALTSADR
jgi:hypothetical protein